jgi:peptide/nickel transport system ATP-binding protein
MSEPILELDDVHCTFQVRQGMFQPSRPLRAVRGVSLKLHRGETLALVGESGCGKSTLARLLLRLEKPTKGAIRFKGRPIEDYPQSTIAQSVQPIFQDPYSSLNPRKTVSSIIATPLAVHRPVPREQWPARVREMMDLVGLPARAHDAYPNQLSGGQRQRVAIARALVTRPVVVICDEPTSALDVSVQAQILNLLLDLQKELGLAYLFISHNLAVVEHLAARVAVMYLGRIVERNDVAAVFDEPRHPYTDLLLKSVLLPRPGARLQVSSAGTSFPNPLDPPSGCAFHTRCPAAMPVCAERHPRPLPAGTEGMVECFLHDVAARQQVAAA